MKFVIELTIFLWISLSIVFGLFTTLNANRETNAYKQVFLWFIAPFVAIAGLIFIDKGNKKHYFKRVSKHLFVR
jgi:hypothetical protein